MGRWEQRFYVDQIELLLVDKPQAYTYEWPAIRFSPRPAMNQWDSAADSKFVFPAIGGDNRDDIIDKSRRD